MTNEPAESAFKEYQTGLICGVAAYGVWGLAPLYWRQYEGVSSLELLFHRVCWGALILFIWIFIKGELSHFRTILKLRWKLLLLLASSFLIFGNWFTFVYAVNTGHVLESSMGYFINPLLNVALGAIFFRERPRPGQMLSISLATLAVVCALYFGDVGRIDLSLLLAGTFGFYGLCRKKIRVSSTHGLFIEMLIAFPICLLTIFYLAPPEFGGGELKFLDFSLARKLGLAFAGVLTVVPLFSFNEAVTRLPLTTMGILQYIAPTGQFLLGHYLYGEPISPMRFFVFGLIWLALIIYTYEGRQYRQRLALRRSRGES